MAEKKMSALERSMHRSFARLQAKGKIAAAARLLGRPADFLLFAAAHGPLLRRLRGHRQH